MMQLDKNWKEYAEKENLKEMGDVTSGMASTVIQIFLQSILDSFVHPSVQVKISSLKDEISLSILYLGPARCFEGDPVDSSAGAGSSRSGHFLCYVYII